MNIQKAKCLAFLGKEKEKALPIKYWTPKMHIKPQQVHVSSLQLKYALHWNFSKSVCSVFKLNYSQIENFHKNAKLLTNRNTFWMLQNAELIIQLLNNINKKVCQIYSKM